MNKPQESYTDYTPASHLFWAQPGGVAKTANRDRLEQALVARHAEIHELLEEVANRADAVNPETADWGHVGDLEHIAHLLRRAAGREE